MIRVPGLRILLGLGFMLAGIWAPKPAQSAKSSDFYCAEMAMQPPAFFDFSVSECADGKEKVTRSVCTVTANCVFLTHEIKTAFKEEKEKSFSEISDDEKMSWLKDYSADWLPTVLVCKSGKKGPNCVECPLPEECKEDIYYNMKSALFDEKKFRGQYNRAREGKQKGFQTGTQKGDQAK